MRFGAPRRGVPWQSGGMTPWRLLVVVGMICACAGSSKEEAKPPPAPPPQPAPVAVGQPGANPVAAPGPQPGGGAPAAGAPAEADQGGSAELESIASPIALFPDPLLGQVL